MRCKMLFRHVFLISLLLFFCSNTVYAIEYKCFVKGSDNDFYITLIDTTDIQDAERAATVAEIQRPQGDTVSTIEVIECKENTHVFNNYLARALERQTPQ